MLSICGHGVLCRVSSSGWARLAGDFSSSYRWLLGEGDDQGVPASLVDAMSSSGSGEGESSSRVLVLPRKASPQRVSALAEGLSACGVRLSAVVNRSALARAADGVTVADTVFDLVDADTEGLVITSVNGRTGTPRLLSADLSGLAFKQRQAVRQAFLNEASFRLSAIGGREEDVEYWLEQQIASGSLRRDRWLTWTVEGESYRIIASAFREQLGLLSVPLAEELLEFSASIKGDARVPLVLEGWLAERFLLGETLATLQSAPPVSLLSVASQARAVDAKLTDGWAPAPGQVTVVAGTEPAQQVSYRVLQPVPAGSVAPAAAPSAAGERTDVPRLTYALAALCLALLICTVYFAMRGPDRAAVDQLQAELTGLQEETSRKQTDAEAALAKLVTQHEEAEREVKQRLDRQKELQEKSKADEGKLEQVGAEVKKGHAEKTDLDGQLRTLRDQRTADQKTKADLEREVREWETKRRDAQLAAGSRLLTVPDAFKTIGEAMAAAKPGDIVRVKPGTYREPVKLAEGVTLIGEPGGGSIIQAPDIELGLEAVVIAHIKTAHVLQMTIDGNKVALGISISSGVVTVTDCTVRNSKLGIVVSANGVLKGNHVTGSTLGDGILFLSGATGKAEGNICEQNEGSGIVASGKGTNPTLVSNECRGNKKRGIAFQDGAGGRAEWNVCEHNEDGIAVFGDGTNPTLSRNRLNNNRDYGLYVGPGARPIGTGRADNTVNGNPKGDISISP